MILKTLALLALAAAPLAAQAPPGVAIDTAASRQLAEAWHRQPGDTLACLYGTGSDTLISIDSLRLAMACGGPGVVGQVGFISQDEDQHAVTAAMGAVLRARPDLWVVGEVHGFEPVFWDGQLHLAARTWYAVRVPDAPAVPGHAS